MAHTLINVAGTEQIKEFFVCLSVHREHCLYELWNLIIGVLISWNKVTLDTVGIADAYLHVTLFLEARIGV